MKSHEEENKLPTMEELKRLADEGKFPSLEEFQRFNPFYEREKAALEFSPQRRLIRMKELLENSKKEDDNNNNSERE
jgi:hypothetical protein